MADIADHLDGGTGTENTIDREDAADLSNHQEAATDNADLHSGSRSAETSRSGIDPSALGGSAQADPNGEAR